MQDCAEWPAAAIVGSNGLRNESTNSWSAISHPQSTTLPTDTVTLAPWVELSEIEMLHSTP